MTEQDATIRVMIADDHPLFRKGLQALIDGFDGFGVVAVARTGDEAALYAVEHTPDVILMDLQMPSGNGLSAIRRIVAAQPDARILVVSLFSDDDSLFAALRAGAHGYVLKDADEETLLRAVQAIAHGEAIFSPAIASRVLSFFSASGRLTGQLALPSLTAREHDILQLVAQGLNNQTIAQRLHLAPKTIANRVSIIFDKLQVVDRAGAIVRANEAGLGR